MSWDRVLKGSQATKPSTVLSTMESRDFLYKVKKLEDLDEISQLLYKDSKLLAERDADAFKAEKKLVNDLCTSLPIREDGRLGDGMREWNEYIRYQEETLNTMANDTNKVIVEPVKRLIAVFPNIQTSIKRRDQLLIEYDKWQQKVDKQKKKERSGPNIVRLDMFQRSLGAAKEEFEAENRELCASMSNFYDQRTEYITPSVQALINLQVRHIGGAFKAYAELEEHFKSDDPINPASTDRFSLTDKNRFNEFKALSIVSYDNV